MLPNPFTEVGRVYSELQSLERQVHSKANDWELSDIKNKLSQMQTEITFLITQIQSLQEAVQGLKDREIYG